jgi:hypothetical protein
MCHVAGTDIQRYGEMRDCLSCYRLTVLANYYSFFPHDTVILRDKLLFLVVLFSEQTTSATITSALFHTFIVRK